MRAFGLHQIIKRQPVNPFIPTAPFLYPLKTSEKRKVFWCFQWLEKGCIGDEWANVVSVAEIVVNEICETMFSFNSLQLINCSFKMCVSIAVKGFELQRRLG